MISLGLPLGDRTLTQAQDHDSFVQAAKRTPVDLREWAVGLMERDNRKSHLAPQLSPATRELLNSSDSPTFHTGSNSTDDRPFDTPTSGEIPIVGSGIISPRHDYGQSSRSPTRNGLPSGRSTGSGHPGMGRIGSSNSSGSQVADYPKSAGAGTFSLPVRPAPPGGPLPPPPPRKGTPGESRRQATFGVPPNRGYADPHNGYNGAN